MGVSKQISISEQAVRQEHREEIIAHANQSFRDEIERAKKMTGEEKVAEGLQLYERFRSVMQAGIRQQFPDASEDFVREKFAERLRINRRLEQLSYEHQ